MLPRRDFLGYISGLLIGLGRARHRAPVLADRGGEVSLPPLPDGNYEGVRWEPLPGTQILGQSEDVEYFRNKLLRPDPRVNRLLREGRDAYLGGERL